MELDWGVGQILNAIKKLGLDKNTLVFFSSDNGAAEVDSAFGEFLDSFYEYMTHVIILSIRIVVDCSELPSAHS